MTTITLSTGETITGTPIHPIWSGTRRDWVPLGELEEEEELLGMYGPVTVMSVQSQTDSQPVYNLEIHGQHVYQIARDGVLVHNTRPLRVHTSRTVLTLLMIIFRYVPLAKSSNVPIVTTSSLKRKESGLKIVDSI